MFGRRLPRAGVYPGPGVTEGTPGIAVILAALGLGHGLQATDRSRRTSRAVGLQDLAQDKLCDLGVLLEDLLDLGLVELVVQVVLDLVVYEIQGEVGDFQDLAGAGLNNYCFALVASSDASIGAGQTIGRDDLNVSDVVQLCAVPSRGFRDSSW